MFPDEPDKKERDRQFDEQQELARTLRKKGYCPKSDESHSDTVAYTTVAYTKEPSFQDSHKGLLWHDMRVIGPSTSTALPGVVRELANRLVRTSESARSGGDPPPHFYSATATAKLDH